MGKRIIQQRRGKGGHTYKVRQKAGKVRPGYINDMGGEFKVVKLTASPGHSIPIAKFVNKEGKVFENFAANLLYETGYVDTSWARDRARRVVTKIAAVSLDQCLGA